LVIDSLTRVARALREVGLAAGEPPARRGFPATVYTLLPQIIERSGTSTKGSVTAIYAVLVEGEMADDPIAEEVQSLTDGHFILSRKLAVKNHFPAIDVLASLSRVMDDLVTDDHKASAGEARKLLAKYESLELLLSLGEYAPGASVENDRAVNLAPSLEQDYLKQSLSDRTEFDLAVKRLGEHVYG
jgi:type III secretion protein N (ATPase)